VLKAGSGQVLTVVAAATKDYSQATATVVINVVKTSPNVAWATPADIVYPTPLSPAQLDATASVTGSFDYSPGTGTVLPPGQDQTLSATFTPSDTVDVNTVTVTTTINVLPATPTPTSTPAPSPSPTPAPSAPVTAQSVAPAAAVTVLGVQWQTHKVSRTRSAKVLVVSYSGALDPTAAANLGAYHLFAPGTGKKLAVHNEKPIALASASYDPSARTVTLTPRGTVAGRGVQLSITAAQVLDTQGRPIDGNGDGQPGGDFVARLS
jgi:hypothetical protein